MYLNKLKPPQYNSNLDEIAINQHAAQSQSIIQFLAMMFNHNNTDANTLKLGGEILKDCVLFLSKNDVEQALKAIKDVLELTRSNAHITIQFITTSFEVDILNVHIFRIFIVVSLTYLLPKLVKTNVILKRLFYLIFKDTHVQSSFLSYYLQTLYLLLKNNWLDLDEIENSLIQLILQCIKTNLSKREKFYSDKIAKIVFDNLTFEKKLNMFANMNKETAWENSTFIFAHNLISRCPDDKLKLYNLNHLVQRLSRAVIDKNVSTSAIKLFSSIIKQMTVEIWSDHFICPLLNMEFKDLEQTSFVKTIIADCIQLAVEHFGVAVFHDALLSNTLIRDTYIRLSVLSCFNLKLFNIEYQNEIIEILQVPDDFLHLRAFHVICNTNSKKHIVEQWQIKTLILYMNNFVFSTGNFSFDELETFLAKICKAANCSLKQDDDYNLNMYTNFVCWLYNFSIENLKSKSGTRINVGIKLLKLIETVICSSMLNSKENCSSSINKENIFFEYLKSINKWKFDKDVIFTILFKEYVENSKTYPEMLHLLSKYVVSISFSNLDKVQHLFKMGMCLILHGVDKESIDKGCQAISCALKHWNVSNNNSEHVIKQIIDKWFYVVEYDFEKQWVNSVLGLTSCTFILLKYNHSQISIDDIFFDKIFNVCQKIIIILSTEYFGKEHELMKNNIKVKSMEQTIIVCLELQLLLIKLTTNEIYLGKIVEAAKVVIVASNARSPISTAAETLRIVFARILQKDMEEQKIIIINFLESVLQSILNPINRVSKLRRSPEHRLIIHAISVNDHLSNRPYLTRAMEFILNVLSDQSSTTDSIVASLHSLEILISDNTMRNSTFQYIERIIMHSIHSFSSNDWRIKNAAIQVLQALVNRILGQKSNFMTRRRHAAEDIYLMYPELTLYFYKVLNKPYFLHNRDSVIAILAILVESHSRLNSFSNKYINFVSGSFLKLLINMVCTDTSEIGMFAAKAYAALYPHNCIPYIIRDILKWLQNVFYIISKNTFHAVVNLIQVLYQKYYSFPNNLLFNEGLSIIHLIFSEWLSFLKKSNYKYEYTLFSLIKVKSSEISNIEMALNANVTTDNYKCRLWLNNNFPYLLQHVTIKNFPDLLRNCFSCSLSLFLLEHCLVAILKRYNELIEHYLVNDVLLIILNKFLELSYECNYLTCTFSSIILLLFENVDFNCEVNLINKLRNLYEQVNKSNIYVISVIVAVLSHYNDHEVSDKTFIKEIIPTYKNAALTDNIQACMHVASTLKYLYICTEVSQRRLIFKLAFILLFNCDTTISTCIFVAFVLQNRYCNLYETLCALLSIDNLNKFLGSPVETTKFLIEIIMFVSSLSDEFQNCGMFYMRQNDDICCHKYPLKKILLEKLKVACSMIGRKDCSNILQLISSIT